MARARFSVEFDGFDEVLNRLKNFEADVKGITEEALKATNDYIVPKLHEAMEPHKRTGKTEASIVEKPNIEWTGDIAKISVGFDIKNGGLPSIFLMYGTPRHRPNHPGTKQDSKLYNAIYGAATKNKIKEIQSEIFYDAIRKYSG